MSFATETSYFPAQKSELHFLIEPSIIAGPAIRCSHRRIDELCRGMLRDPRKNCGSYFGAWSSLVYGSLRGYSRRIPRAFLGGEAAVQHPSAICEAIGNSSAGQRELH